VVVLLTIEDDALTLMQGVIMIAGPILFYKTMALWLGIMAGGAAKSQACFTFCNDPMTIFATIACASVMICFWMYALVSRRFKSD
jgi:hypothetical protein